MRSVETDWWTMDLPDEWDAEQDEEIIVLSDEDGVGVLEITTLEKDGEHADAADFKQLSQALVPEGTPGKNVQIGEFAGLCFEYSESGDAVREWLLRGANLLLFISYSCSVEHQGFDDAMVDEMLETLQSRPPQ